MDSDYADSEYGSSDYGGSQSMDYQSESDGDFGFDPHAEVEPSARKAKYAVYNEEQLHERQQEALNQVTSVLSISQGEAARVLRLYKWDVNRVNEEWFADMDGVRDKVGLMEEQSTASTSGKSKLTCPICFDAFPVAAMCAAKCRHYFCKNCWRGYVSTAIGNGPSVLSLRCPLPDCKVAVPRSIIWEVLGEADKKRYSAYLMRSYVDDNRRLTWCPAPGCEHAAECLGDLSGEPMDIRCKCGTNFCFNCQEEAHRPVDCATVSKWLVKNSAESENLNWILANTKPCPKCKRPIEKNQGCMHMTCSQCKFEFCWLCLGSWAEHGERTGGFYACNRYESAKRKGEYDEEDVRREHARNSLERYMHYYQRWHEHDKAKNLARASMKDVAEGKLEALSEITATPTSQLKFILDAWAQVVDCRRILKWTYAYGYYRFAEVLEADKQQQEFFEFNQSQAESYLEKLHGLAEKELNKYVERAPDAEPWPKFRESLIGLIDVTRSHFDKLVTELERGLDHLLDDYAGVQADEEAASAMDNDGGASGSHEAAPAAVGVQTRRASKRTRGGPRGDSPASGHA